MSKTFIWDNEKNAELVSKRGISFEMISRAVDDGKLLEIIDHPSRLNQQLMVVRLGDYAVVVPFVETDESIFLKTAYASRKYTKKYLR